jgi:hypothetical protein
MQLRTMRFAAFVCVVDTDRQQSRRGSDRVYVREFTMRYRSVAMSVAVLALAPIAVADAQSVYVAPGGVYVASGNVYVTPAPGPYGAPVPGVADPTSAYPPPPYGAPATVYAAPPAVYGEPAPPAYGAPLSAYGAVPGRAYVVREPGYGVRHRALAPTEAYATELPPRPPAPVPYGARRW